MDPGSFDRGRPC